MKQTNPKTFGGLARNGHKHSPVGGKVFSNGGMPKPSKGAKKATRSDVTKAVTVPKKKNISSDGMGGSSTLAYARPLKPANRKILKYSRS
jgi:hypothetical protein